MVEWVPRNFSGPQIPQFQFARDDDETLAIRRGAEQIVDRNRKKTRAAKSPAGEHIDFLASITLNRQHDGCVAWLATHALQFRPAGKLQGSGRARSEAPAPHRAVP